MPNYVRAALRPSPSIVLFILLTAGLAAAETAALPPGVEPLDMPNPAALYCTELGIPYEIVFDEDGERGLALLPDGRRVDAWSFYRGETGAAFGDTALRRMLDAELFAAEARPAAPLEWGRAGRELPASFDWRDLDGCTPIRDQASCGSCWAFGTMAPLECGILIKDGVEVDLSEQWLVSCNSDGYGCGGGWWVHDYHLWKDDPCGGNGAVLEADFPYQAADLPCDCPYPHHFWLDDWAFIGEQWTVPAVALIKEAIYLHGPVSVAVSVNSAFSDYDGGIFHDPNSGQINHAVALVGWNDAEGVWILRNSWGTDWGEDGYMRITYGSRDVGYHSCFVEYRDPLAIGIEGGEPETLPVGLPCALDVRIDELADSYVAGSGALHYRRDDGAFLVAPLQAQGGGLHRAVLPGPACGEVTEYYVSAQAADYGEILWPDGGAEAPLRAYTGTASPVFADDFESHQGWTVDNDAGLGDGPWERGVPVAGDRGDPPSDHDGSGRCYVTDNVAGNSDVDDGATRLVSPVFELDPAREYLVHYALWYTNYWGADPENDVFDVDVSVNGGATWFLIRRHGPRTLPGWTEHCFRLNDYVTPGAQIRLRFEASDLGDGSVVEAGLDDFVLSELSCGGTAAGHAPPAGVALLPNVPNPFNPSTTLRFSLDAETPVTLSIHDLSGRRLRLLLDGESCSAGQHERIWDGCDASGRELSSGVYLCRLKAGERSLSHKLILMK